MLPLIVGKVLVGGAQNISGQDFLKKIAPCYLRRVYKNDQSGELLATWMCAEGQSKSRVVIAKVAEATAGVALTVELEQRNARPAPARVESAFANERN
ncbi:hypothetical protein QH494_00150 [Sphingomonas sp. AR_OL41]|nr:hypothetical protein [Sphingomonas sp. AR_OL41]MDH7970584.1 hypothetical protein [Sphingomonas sp. AR_OL41]